MVVMVMVMVMVMIVAAIAGHYDHGPTIGRVISRIERVMMVMVVVMMVVELSLLHRRFRQLGLIDGPQRFRRVRDRLQQFGVGICPKHFRWVLGRRGLGRIQAAKRRDGAQQSSDLLVHIYLQCALPLSETRPLRIGSASMVS